MNKLIWDIQNPNDLSSNKRGPLVEFVYKSEKRVILDLSEVISIFMYLPEEKDSDINPNPYVEINFTGRNLIMFSFSDGWATAKKVYLYLKTEWQKLYPAEGGPELLQEVAKLSPEA